MIRLSRSIPAVAFRSDWLQDCQCPHQSCLVWELKLQSAEQLLPSTPFPTEKDFCSRGLIKDSVLKILAFM